MKGKLHSYTELDAVSREAARLSAIKGELWLVRHNIKVQREKSLADINIAINDMHHIRRLWSGLNQVKKMDSTDFKWIENSLNQNVCQFNIQGDMFLFTQRKFVSEI